MFIEVRKAEFLNKGAELMLRAAVEQIRARYPQSKLVMGPGHEKTAAPYLKRAQLGAYQKAWLWRAGWQLGDLAALAPAKLREAYGVVLDREIHAVLDAAGFLYSDQQGSSYLHELSRASLRWKARGTRVVLLPQAFGPFREESSKDAVRRIVDNVDLIFAREEDSFRHLQDIVGPVENIRIAPDFTNLIAGYIPPDFDRNALQVAVVPNYKMIQKGAGGAREQYVPFLAKVMRHLKMRDARPFFLIHEGQRDREIADRVASEVGDVRIVENPDPLAIKGILGACRASVGSRYHGLVSALSQGVPALATGWSHKYQMLYKDYELAEGMLDVGIEEASLAESLDRLIDPRIHEATSARLQQRSEILKQKTRDMWAQVFKVIET